MNAKSNWPLSPREIRRSSVSSAGASCRYDAEDSVRFYALRMHHAGLIKSNPNNLITKHTDWRFLNQLKKELKG